MDPIMVHELGEAIGPALAILMIGIIPITLVFMSKYFKLKTREMELETELHSKETQARLSTLEARQAAYESALTAIASGIASSQLRQDRADLAADRAADRAALMEPPPVATEGPLAPGPMRVVRDQK